MSFNENNRQLIKSITQEADFDKDRKAELFEFDDERNDKSSDNDKNFQYYDDSEGSDVFSEVENESVVSEDEESKEEALQLRQDGIKNYDFVKRLVFIRLNPLQNLFT